MRHEVALIYFAFLRGYVERDIMSQTFHTQEQPAT